MKIFIGIILGVVFCVDTPSSFAEEKKSQFVEKRLAACKNTGKGKSKCAPEPNFAHDRWKTKAPSVCVDCEKRDDALTGLNLWGQVKQVVQKEQVMRWVDLKSEDEVDAWIACWGPKKGFCHYSADLKNYIRLASEVSGFPYAVQACLFLRESGWTARARSYVGAYGYTQFMPGTHNRVDQIVKGNWKKLVDSKNEQIAKFEAELAAGNVSEKRVKWIHARVKYLKLTLNTAMANYRAQLAWNKYWEGTPNAPKRFTSNDPTCPSTAFIGSVVKQLYDAQLFAHRNDKEVKISAIDEDAKPQFQFEGMDPADSSLINTGTYNAGVGGFSKRCGDALSVADCLARFKKKSGESYRHVTYISNCAKKGYMNHPFDEGKSNKECSL